jgi:hypothetical protein
LYGTTAAERTLAHSFFSSGTIRGVGGVCHLIRLALAEKRKLFLLNFKKQNAIGKPSRFRPVSKGKIIGIKILYFLRIA